MTRSEIARACHEARSQLTVSASTLPPIMVAERLIDLIGEVATPEPNRETLSPYDRAVQFLMHG